MTDNIPEWLIRENTNLQKEIERLREEIQQLKHDSTIFINERSDAICENFDLREENAELQDEIERLRAALREIEWSNDSKWQSDRARAALGEKTDD